MAGHFVGLMSGTSMDGIDAVVVRFDDAAVDIVATHSQPYPQELKAALLSAIRQPLSVELDTDGNLHRQIGQCFSEAAQLVIAKSGLARSDIEAIASHGQTLRHQPDADEPFSLQIGDADIISRQTGITTVANFREADISVGGQGAPLVPPFHDWLLRSETTHRVVVNIGGISNVTVLPANADPVIGFDTGPGNGLMDAWIRQHKNVSYDSNGEWAASGSTSAELLEAMLLDPYFSLPAPKSTGFEYFNLDWLAQFDCGQYDAADIQATLCELTARSIALSIANYAPQTEELFVCGGGSHNAELMRRLQSSMSTASCATTQSVGLDPDWIEAIAFAWLAMRTLNGQTGNLPSVTGASREVVLGDIHLP